VTVELEVVRGAPEAERRVGEVVAERARVGVESGGFSVALSKATPTMLDAFVARVERWDAIAVFQVDERVAPAGTPDRNLTAIVAALPAEALDSLRPLPVEAPDLEDAARLYEVELPEALDLVHVGLGPDGHTASLVPGDEVLDVRDRAVAVTGRYEGFRRLTLTYPALDAAREIVWLVTGDAKQDALARLLAGDESIPATRISNPNQLVVADAAAAGR
jgi:6-phosphogluconolactonase